MRRSIALPTASRPLTSTRTWPLALPTVTSLILADWPVRLDAVHRAAIETSAGALPATIEEMVADWPPQVAELEGPDTHQRLIRRRPQSAQSASVRVLSLAASSEAPPFSTFLGAAHIFSGNTEHREVY